MQPNDPATRFRERQRAHFAQAQIDHLRWQTTHPLLAETERRLLEGIGPLIRPPFLEVGCGEGANLHHLGTAATNAVAFDWSLPKVSFARGARPGLRGVCGNVEALPFRPGSFETILVRDLLHHLPDPARALRRIAGLLRPKGRLLVIEPNGRNLLMAAFAWSTAAERGMLASTPARLQRMAEGPLRLLSLEMRQPFPLSRVLCHYRWGWPSLGYRPTIRRVLTGLEDMFRRLLPRRQWAYIVLVLRRSEETA